MGKKPTLTDEAREYFRQCGKKSTGGKKNREKGSEYFREIGRKGGLAKGKKKIKLSTGTPIA